MGKRGNLRILRKVAMPANAGFFREAMPHDRSTDYACKEADRARPVPTRFGGFGMVGKREKDGKNGKNGNFADFGWRTGHEL